MEVAVWIRFMKLEVLFLKRIEIDLGEQFGRGETFVIEAKNAPA